MKQAFFDVLRRKTAWIGALALLAVLNAAAVIIIEACQAPGLERKKSARNELRRKLSAAGGRDTRAALYNGKRDLERLRTLIDLKRDFPALLGEFMEAASSCNVAMGAITYKPAIIKEHRLQAYDVTMSVTGRYGAIKSFLFDLLMFNGLVVVDGIRLSNEGPYVENITMEARLMVYLRDEA